MAELPMVSALMAAYNYERFVARAIESALEQDYPADRLEVVVVDDGSTDGTSEIVADLARRHPDRVRHIRQANAGYVAASDRAMAEARGEVLALLDADDVWLPHKARRQAELLQARPELGMVFSDMAIVDAEEHTVHPSLAWHIQDLAEHTFARVLWENVATQSSIAFRADMREHVHPIPAGVPYADWWITLRCAQLSRIDHVREPLALYRVHGANLTGEVKGPAAVREARKTLYFQLWVLRHLPRVPMTPEEMTYVWGGVERQAQKVVSAAGSQFASLVDLKPEPQRTDELLAQAARAGGLGALERQAGLILQALAFDPGRPGLRELLETRAREAQASPNPLAGARGLVVLVDAEELLAGDELLADYARALDGTPGITLAIDATRLEPEAAGPQLQELVARCGLDERGELEMVAVVGERSGEERRRMLARADARYGRGEAPAGSRDGEAPRFTPDTLDELVALARERTRPEA